MLLSRSASMMSMFSSPGIPKMYSTPSFSRHLTNSWAAVVMGLQWIVGCELFVAIGDAVDLQLRNLRYTPRQRLRKLPCRRFPAQVAGANLVDVQRLVDALAHTPREVIAADMVEHHRSREDPRQRIGKALARDVGRGAVHRIEYRGVGA